MVTGLGDDERTQHGREPQREGEALLIPSRRDEIKSQLAETRQREEEYNKRQVEANEYIRTFTGLLVITSIVAGAISIVQAGISKDAVELTRESAHTDARAWVGLASPVAVTNMQWPNGRWTFWIQNFGKTPAFKYSAPAVVTQGDYDPKKVREEQNVNCNTEMYERDTSGTWGETIWPGDKREIITNIQVPPFIGGGKVLGNGKPIHFVGCINYVDVAGHYHWTRFCYRSVSNATNQTFAACGQGNYTDDADKPPKRPRPWWRFGFWFPPLLGALSIRC